MTEEEREIYFKSSLNKIPYSWERMKWIKETERKIDIENVITREITRCLYHSGTLSYVNGNYSASILSISSAIDSFLSSIISATEFSERTLLSARIQKAREDNKISLDISNELEIFNAKIRNHLVHPKGPFTHFFLGGEFDNKKGSWTKTFQLDDIAIVKDNTIHALKMDPNTNVKHVCEYSILLFMRTVRDHLNLKKLSDTHE